MPEQRRQTASETRDDRMDRREEIRDERRERRDEVRDERRDYVDDIREDRKDFVEDVRDDRKDYWDDVEDEVRRARRRRYAVGTRVNHLPHGCARVYDRYRRNHYCYDSGVYYSQYYGSGDVYYTVVEPSTGTIVYELPEGYEIVAIDGVTYYVFSDLYYERIHYQDQLAYIVVDSP